MTSEQSVLCWQAAAEPLSADAHPLSAASLKV